MRKTLEVATLLGHAHVEMAQACLGSLRRYSLEPVRLRIHDDGTLTEEDRDRLSTGLGEPVFVFRPEADERVGALLDRHPALRAFRAANPLALKLIDVPLVSPCDLAYCDSDVLFLRPFTGLFEFPEAGTGAVFMSDRQNAYSVRSWHLLRHGRLHLPCRVNSGVLLFQRRFHDLDLLEWFFGQPEFQRTPVWAEQTAWALLGERAGCHLWDPSLLRLPDNVASGDPVALHFVSPLRGLLLPFMKRTVDRMGEPPVRVGTVPAKRCHAWDLAWTEAKRRLGRGLS